MDEDFIRTYMHGGHIPGIPGFFPVGIPVRIDERTNTIIPDESPPPALPLQEEPVAQDNQSEPVQGDALPVRPFGMLGGK